MDSGITAADVLASATQADLLAHASDTTNPHEVTAAQTGATTAADVAGMLASQTHVIADTIGLQAALDAKAEGIHTHTLSQISDAGTAAARDVGTTEGDVAVLGANGTFDAARLPGVAWTDYLGDVADDAEMLTLRGERGDWCNNFARSRTMVIIGNGDGSQLAHWKEHLTPTGGITSWNELLGPAISATTDDMPEGTNGDRRYYTAAREAAKADASHSHPISDVTDLQTTLDGKASSSHDHDSRYYTEAEVNTALSGKAATIHTHAISDTTNLQTTLDAKASTSHAHDATYAKLNATQTITGDQTITGQIIVSKAIRSGTGNTATVNAGGTLNWVCTDYGLLPATINGNFTLAAPTGTPVDGSSRMLFRLRNASASPVTITYASNTYRWGTDIAAADTQTLPASKTCYLGVIYNSVATRWDVVTWIGGF